MKNLVTKWGNLSLDDREGGEVQLNDNESLKNVTIAVKFLTKRALNTESVVRTFNPIWRPKNGFKVRRVGDHTILFIFDNEEEVEKIIEVEPWSFDKHLVMLKQYDYSIPIQDLTFDHVSLWVQVHDIPAKYLSREVAEKLCEAVGVVNKESSLGEVDRGTIMQVRVKVDVTLPLYRGRIFKLGNGSRGWVTFKYERLPNVCYWCGRLNHVNRDCERWIQSSGTLTKEEQEYGSWLRASSLPAHNNSVLVVPGFYEAKKKELDRNKKPKEIFSSGNLGEACGKVGAAEQGRSPVEEALGSKMKAVNAHIMEEDVMDVTHKEGSTGDKAESLQLGKGAGFQGKLFKEKLCEITVDSTSDEAESIQLGKGAGFQGELFNEKLREIELELNKFDLEKGSTTGSVLIEIGRAHV